LPFPGNVRAERGPLDIETALLLHCEPVGFHAEFWPALLREARPFPVNSLPDAARPLKILPFCPVPEPAETAAKGAAGRG
jgi:hypothetical protein